MQPLLRPDEERAFEAERPRVLVLACGAIAREVLAVIDLNGWTHVDVRCLPAKLHSTPERIPAAVDAKLTELEGSYERVFVAYADCGTGGALDAVLERHDVERLPGDHCYGFLTGNTAWTELHDAEPAIAPGEQPQDRGGTLDRLDPTRQRDNSLNERTPPRVASGPRRRYVYSASNQSNVRVTARFQYL